MSLEQENATREVLDRFEKQIHSELRQLDDTLASLPREQGLEVFPLNENMLDRAVSLSALDLSLKPFDQAILAAVLVRAGELRQVGEVDLCFCEMDSDLQPWDKHGNAKQPLTDLYDNATLWVYGDFSLRAPERPEQWLDWRQVCLVKCPFGSILTAIPPAQPPSDTTPAPQNRIRS